MRVLGIETSCDDTSAAVVEDGKVRSSVVSSQTALHRPFRGVVPELASRAHLSNLVPVVERALAGAGRGAVDAVAFTRGPGLMGPLLV
ncbi:MAG TPA: tRNA (adenosine(37)-N6)-threonylcarbamoyltransferase complex transferase subunit TsaD, partial [Elusimicrobiota bacterium]|nr:tRNA (adenosine(37)-N6)-threonylcarbamoyltransferase complex transferase subunit TsaD [Elusimicrobiota bacterium]